MAIKTTRMSLDRSLKDPKRTNPEKKPNAKTSHAIDDARKEKVLKAKDITDLYDKLRI